MTIEELDTPALLIDLDRLDANLERTAAYAAEHGLGLRPHTKTHKSPVVGRMQLDLGAVGLTVAKVGEAEVMAQDGVPNILVAYPVWGDAKWRRLIQVASSVPVTVALDSAVVAEGVSRHASQAGLEVSVLVEADVGMQRCGLPPGEELRALARQVAALPALHLEGLMFYPGHIDPSGPGAERELGRLRTELDRILAAFREDGLPTEVVSGGSTPTLFRSHEIPGLTEIRPGTYVFNDCTQVAMGACGWDDCAATVMTTVVSRPDSARAVVDGGSKTFTSDPLRPSRAGGGYGRVLEAPDARFARMSEEHGVLDLRDCQGQPLRVGDRLRIIPNHVCVAVNMHERAYGVRGGTVERSWPVAGRGKLQ